MSDTPTAPPCPRALIIDDDLDHQALLVDAMDMYFTRTEDSRLQCAATGAQALQETIKDYDVVLLDLHLPDVNGLDLLAEILTRADVPVLIVTGENDSGTAARAIELGAQDYICKHGDYLLAIPPLVQKNISLHQIKKEHDRLEIRLQWMLEELQDKNLQLEESMKQLKQLATTDALTGLANRRYFNEQLDRQFSQAQRYHDDLTCCMIDLDHYKQLNDTHGHQMGDEVLQIVAAEITACLRSTDIAARYGGDEFILLLPRTGLPEATNAVKRIRENTIATLRSDTRIRVPITLSIGVASLVDDTPHTAEALVAMADRALYTAKDLGKDRVVIHRDMRDQIIESIASNQPGPEPIHPTWLE